MRKYTTKKDLINKKTNKCIICKEKPEYCECVEKYQKKIHIIYSANQPKEFESYSQTKEQYE